MGQSKAWKDFEDRICKALGGRRVLGNRGSSVPDSDENVQFSVEAKHGYGRYQLREDWLEQARRNEVVGKPWILVQAPKRKKPIVSMEWDDFLTLASAAGRITPNREGLTDVEREGADRAGSDSGGADPQHDGSVVLEQ